MEDRDINVDNVETNVHAENSVAQNEVKQPNGSLLSKAGSFGEKVCEKERKHGYIGNAIVLAMSVIMFICSFFMGTRLQYIELNYGIVDGDVNPRCTESEVNTIDMIDGLLILLKGNDGARAYIDEAGDKLQVKIDEASEKIQAAIEEKNLDSKNPDDVKKMLKLQEKYCAEAFESADVNVFKFNVAYLRYMAEKSPESLAQQSGFALSMVLSLVSFIMNIVCMITSLVFIIKSVIALVKKREMKKQYPAFKKMLGLSVSTFTLMAVNALGAPSAAMKALFALAIILTVAMFAYKHLVVEPWGSFNLMGTIKNGSLFVLSLIAFLLLTGNIYGYKFIESDYTFTFMFGGNAFGDMNINMAFAGGYLGYGMMLFWFFWLSSLTAIGKLMRKFADAVYNKDYSKKKVLSDIIGTLVVLLLIVVAIIVFNTVDISYISPKRPLVLGACLIAAIVFLIGMIVVKGVLKVKDGGNVIGEKKENVIGQPEATVAQAQAAAQTSDEGKTTITPADGFKF